MKIMTFNIRIDSNKDPQPWADRKDYIAQIIDKYQPDIIGFQEVLKHMEADLAAMLAEYSYYGEYRSEDDRSEMVPIFLKKEQFEMGDRGSFMLSETPAVMYNKGWDAEIERVVSWAIINDRDSQEAKYLAVNAHFDHLGVEAQRQSSIMMNQTISEMIEKVNVPVIMTGDFNVQPNSDVLDALLESDHLNNSYQVLKENAVSDELLTFHDYKGDIKGLPIDYIFITKDLEIKNAEIIRDHFDGYYPSDHYPILVEV